MKKIFNQSSYRIAALALGAALMLGGASVAFTQKPKAPALALPPVDERPVPRDAGGHASFAPIVKKVSPAVVKVFTTTKIHNTAYNGMPEIDEFWRRFFGDEFPGRGPRRNYGTPRQQGIGSGVIATKDGYILTNNHVVDGADEVKVALQDGREFTAKVIGRDPKSDVAVIKIDAKDLPAVPMADSDKVEVGDIVLAIGNPFGIGQTVTTGIVSATGRGNMGLPAPRDQHRYPQPQRRQPGHRVRDPGQPGPRRDGEFGQRRPCHARLPGCDDPGHQPSPGQPV